MLFAAALGKPAAERTIFLDGACYGDPGLRQRLETLLAAQQKADELPPSDVAAAKATIQRDLAEAEDDPEGKTIGRYKVLERLGEGGCGVVYVAEQTEPVRRRIALKVIKLGMDTEQVVARFEAERQALAMMDHPNIAKVLDAGATQTGRPYFVMELVRGIKITEYCDQNLLTTTERIDLFINVCHAIQHAHQKGIIHRDIKPSNILVTLHDSVPVPKVIDFGIAKATEGRLTDSTVYTELHQFVGTPAYMSPEQAEMSGLDIDTRSDIYSLGVLLYEMLAGSTPFDGYELMSQGIDAMRKTIREKEPMRPSTRLATLKGEELTRMAKRQSADTSKLLHQLKGDLDWIVMKCLEKDRTRRYETANGLAFDLRRHLNNEPVLARPPSTTYKLQKAIRRNKLAFAAAMAVAGALVVGTTVSSWQAIEARRARNAEEEQRLAAQSERDKAQTAQQLAQRAQQAEKQERQRAEKGETEARQNLYAAHMNLALQAVEEQNIGYALSLLDLHRPQAGQPDLRGWEWRYLWKLCRSDELRRLGSHSNSAVAAVFSPKGDVLATCSDDHTVKLWDMSTQRNSAVLLHQGAVLAAAFSADGKRLTTVCIDGANGDLRLWDVATGGELRRLALGNMANLAGAWPGMFAFTSGGEMFAFAATERVCVWDVVRGTGLSVHETARSPVSLAFSPNGKTLAAGYRDRNNSVALWDLSRAEKPAQILLLTNSYEVRSLSFSFDGQTLAGGCRDGTIKLWDLATGREIRALTGHSSWIPTMAFSSDGKMLASASADHTARLWDVATGQSTTLHGHLNEVWAIAMAPDGRTVATGTKKEGIVSLWSTTPKPLEQTSQTLRKMLHRGDAGPGTLSPDGTAFLAVYADRTAGLWETASLKETTNFPLDMADHSCLALSPLGKLIALGNPDGTVRLVQSSTWREIDSFESQGAGVVALAFSLDGQKLAVATADHKFRVWETATKRVLSEMASRSELVPLLSSFVFSPDALALCAAYQDRTAEIFDTATGSRLGLLEGAKAPISGAVLLPDGRTAATADMAQDVKLWDLKTQKDLVTFRGEKLAHFAITLSPDGRRLAAGGGGSGEVRLWDPATRQQVALLKLPNHAAFKEMAFSADGNMLVLVDDQDTLRTWRAPSWEEIAAAEAKDPASEGYGGRGRAEVPRP